MGLFVGIGSALGNYLVQKSIIKRLEKLEHNAKHNKNSE